MVRTMDEQFLSAFNTGQVELTLAEPTLVNRLYLHNLKLSGHEATDASVTLQFKNESGDWQEIDQVAVGKFFAYPLESPMVATAIRLVFSHDIVDIQEVTLY